MLELFGMIGGALLGLFGIIALFFNIRQGGVDAQKSKDQEAQLEQVVKVGDRVNRAQDAGNRTDSDLKSHPDKLREDDGYRRD